MEYFGIDFGTTNTAVYYINQLDDGEIMSLKIGEDGNYPFSSMIAISKNIEERKLLVGRKVKNEQYDLTKDFYIFSSMKSYLGKKDIIKENISVNPTSLTKDFLKYIKKYICKNYLQRDPGREIINAVFSFPVDFSRDARRELKKAAEGAGFKVLYFINEATSAYIANMDKLSNASRILVIDWGGGTLDINLIERKGNLIYELIPPVSENIGGDDIDKEFALRMHARFMEEYNLNKEFDKMSPGDKDKIRIRCEEAKIEFSNPDSEELEIIVDDYETDGLKQITVKYNEFYNIIRPLLEKRVLPKILNVLNTAQINPEGIDSVLLIGGSSQIIAFKKIIEELFDISKIKISDEPDFSVAIGAAKFNLFGGHFKLSDDLGILLSDNTIYPIFKKNEDGVGSSKGPFSFALTEDSQSANFIFAQSNGIEKKIYPPEMVPVKGFLDENIILNATIENDQIAELEMKSNSMASDYFHPTNKKTVHIKDLAFYYEIDTQMDET
ncbi:Hsp70 family protein [Treponema primitia]|uniref:Hsp70 family protein n=1 Tax=Treponema primitia TaxID=88058 RepID=UPI0039815802